MRALTMEELQQLNEIKGENCISIYLPTHRGGKEVTANEDARLLKSLVQKIKFRLTDQGINDGEVQRYLGQVYDLIDNTSFWRDQQDGLAIFLAKDFFRYYRMPYRFDEFTLVSDSFYLKPLIPAFDDRDYYHILAVSLHKIRFFEANRFYINELKLEDIFPENVDEILSYYQFEQSLQMRSQHGGMSSGDNVQYYGQGGSKRDNTPYIKEYFREIDKGIGRITTSTPIPMVIAAVEYLHPIYKEVNTHAEIMEKGIMGNHDMAEPKELHAKSLEIMEPYFHRQRESRRNKYQQLAGSGKTSRDINEIVTAAVNGRIEALFVAKGANMWGKLKDENGLKTELHETFQDNDNCLIDLSAVNTLLNGGETYLVDREYIPQDGAETPVAALFRY